MRKILLCTLTLTALLLLGGCFVKTSPNEDKPLQQNATPPASAAAQISRLTAAAEALPLGGRQEFTVTPQLKGAFFDIVQAERWDFLPSTISEELESDENFFNYVYWALAKSLVWENYGSIDHEQSPEKIAARTMQENIQTHFGLDLPTPEPGYIYGMDFDGEYYYYPATSWAEPSAWELEKLTLENVEGEIIYTADMLAYGNTGDSIEYPPENARQLISEGLGLPEPFEVTEKYQISFRFNENGEIRYLGYAHESLK